MKSGQVVAAGSPKEIKTTYAEEFTSLIQETQRTYSRPNSETSPRSRTTSRDSEDSELGLFFHLFFLDVVRCLLDFGTSLCFV